MPWAVGQNGIISFGGDYNITGSIFLEDRIVTTQHIGDAEDIEILDYLKDSLNFIIKNYNISSFSKVACDLNPSFQTSRYAKEFAIKNEISVTPVQHHHAHMAALMADNSLTKDDHIICLAIDGVGYGLDGMAWGGEVLVGGYQSFERVGQLKYQPMPGGDICAKYPARMLAAIMASILSHDEIHTLFEGTLEGYLKHGKDELDVILTQSKNSNVMKTSSIGRLLDSISALLEICGLRTYEGEPPMRLETIAKQGKDLDIPLRLPISEQNNKYVIDSSDLILSIIENIKNENKQNIAFGVHKQLGLVLGRIASQVADEYGIEKIGIVGGAAVNSLLLKFISEKIIEHKKQLIFYRSLPCGDGGISTGQVAVTSKEL
jgi:hydrogenase maturation protein HypF